MTANTPRYVVLTASANMPSSCWGRYGRVAVVELEHGFDGRPKMISDRARGVRRVVATWERQHVGRTPRSAFARACADARALAAQLNAAQ